MKNIFILSLLALSFLGCNSDDLVEDEATLLGRWVLEGFEDQIRYDFTTVERFTVYSDNGTFPTLAEFLNQNPGTPGNPWLYEGDTVVVDLHFGNYSRLIPEFKCGNKVIDWMAMDGSLHSTYYREDHNIASCN